VETFATWATTLIVKAVAIIGAIGGAVVTCGHEVSHGTRITKPRETPTRVRLVFFLGTRGPVVETAVSRSQVDHIWYPGRIGYAFMKALTEAGSLGGSKLNLKGTGWKTGDTSRSMDGDKVASGTDCTVISGTRQTPNKPFASVLASSVRLGLACCGETTPVIVSGMRTTPDMSPAGVPASSTRSTADEVPPPAWPRLPRLLLRRGRRRDKPGCCSSATGGRRRRVRRRRAS
jgi:hypothetical protein